MHGRQPIAIGHLSHSGDLKIEILSLKKNLTQSMKSLFIFEKMLKKYNRLREMAWFSMEVTISILKES